jgi:hypothetical protein
MPVESNLRSTNLNSAPLAQDTSIFQASSLRDAVEFLDAWNTLLFTSGSVAGIYGSEDPVWIASEQNFERPFILR